MQTYVRKAMRRTLMVMFVISYVYMGSQIIIRNLLDEDLGRGLPMCGSQTEMV